MFDKIIKPDWTGIFKKIKSFITLRMIILSVLLLIATVVMVVTLVNKEKPTDLNRSNTLYEKGLQKVEEKKYEEAIELFTQVIEISPEYNKAYAKRGAVKAEFLNRHEEAMPDYDKALELNPKDALTLHNRGISRIKLNQLEEAVEDFTRAVLTKPTYYIAHNSRGVAHGMLGDYEKAITDFESALIIKPNYTNAKFNKIFAKVKMDKKDEALKDAKALLAEIDKEKESGEYQKLEKLIDYIEQSKKSVFKKSF